MCVASIQEKDVLYPPRYGEHLNELSKSLGNSAPPPQTTIQLDTFVIYILGGSFKKK